MVDFSKINNKSDMFGVPFNSDSEIFQQIPSEAYSFLTLDLTSSFFQLHVHPDNQAYLAFLVSCGKFLMTRAAIGEKNSGN